MTESPVESVGHRLMGGGNSVSPAGGFSHPSPDDDLQVLGTAFDTRVISVDIDREATVLDRDAFDPYAADLAGKVRVDEHLAVGDRRIEAQE